MQGVHFSSVNPVYNNGYSLNTVYNHGGPRYAPNLGGLLLRCTAQIGDLYQEYKEIELGTPQKDPVPARGKLAHFQCTLSESKLITQKYICFPFPFFNPSPLPLLCVCLPASGYSYALLRLEHEKLLQHVFFHIGSGIPTERRCPHSAYCYSTGCASS